MFIMPEHRGEHFKKLNEGQTTHFDKDYADPPKFELLSAKIDKAFGTRPFTFLDIGGGSGRLADTLLERFSNAKGVVLDNSSVLLNANKSHPRKDLVSASAENLTSATGGRRFDIICFHWVLHHFVGHSYRESLANIGNALKQAKSLLNPGGYISVFENCYESYFFDSFCSRAIFALSSSPIIAPVMKIVGVKTAGCGVCFLSKYSWLKQFSLAGIKPVEIWDDHDWRLSLTQKLSGAKRVYVSHFWCR